MPQRNPNIKTGVKGASLTNGVKTVEQGIANWFKKGAPLPGATYPPAGKAYLRGQLINAPKRPVNQTPAKTILEGVTNKLRSIPKGAAKDQMRNAQIKSAQDYFKGLKK